MSTARVYAGSLLRRCSQRHNLKTPVHQTSNVRASSRTSRLYSPVCAISFTCVRVVPVFPALRLSGSLQHLAPFLGLSQILVVFRCRCSCKVLSFHTGFNHFSTDGKRNPSLLWFKCSCPFISVTCLQFYSNAVT
jgi:hypothetical protein